MPYWEIVSRSFRIAWNHKYLWLIALFSGESSGGANFNYPQGTTRPAGTAGNPGTPDVSVIQHQVSTWIADHVALIVLVAIVWLVLAVALFILAAVCEGATVRASAEHDAERPFRLGWAWRSGVSTMWTIVRFRLLLIALGLPLLVIYGGLGTAVVIAFVTNNYGWLVPFILVGLLLALVAIPYAIYLSFLDRFGARALVLEQLQARPSIVRAHRLLRKRLGRSLLVWLVSIGLAIALGIGFACALAIIAVPVALVGVAIAAASSAAAVPLIVLGVLILIPIALVVNGFIAAQTSTYWTLAYRRLDLDYPAPAAVQYAPIAPPQPPPPPLPQPPQAPTS